MKNLKLIEILNNSNTAGEVFSAFRQLSNLANNALVKNDLKLNEEERSALIKASFVISDSLYKVVDLNDLYEESFWHSMSSIEDKLAEKDIYLKAEYFDYELLGIRQINDKTVTSIIKNHEKKELEIIDIPKDEIRDYLNIADKEIISKIKEHSTPYISKMVDRLKLYEKLIDNRVKELSALFSKKTPSEKIMDYSINDNSEVKILATNKEFEGSSIEYSNYTVYEMTLSSDCLLIKDKIEEKSFNDLATAKQHFAITSNNNNLFSSGELNEKICKIEYSRKDSEYVVYQQDELDFNNWEKIEIDDSIKNDIKKYFDINVDSKDTIIELDFEEKGYLLSNDLLLEDLEVAEEFTLGDFEVLSRKMIGDNEKANQYTLDNAYDFEKINELLEKEEPSIDERYSYDDLNNLLNR